MNKITTIFFLCPFFIFAQPKSAQVAAYLGERVIDQLKTDAEIDFYFTTRTITAQGRTGQTIVEVLRGVQYFREADDAGPLKAIAVGGVKMENAAPPKTNVKSTGSGGAVPIPAQHEETFTTRMEALPDSAALEIRKQSFRADMRHYWKQFKPSLDYWMWVYMQFLIPILVICGVLWGIAKLSAKDGIKDLYGVPLIGNVITKAHLWSKGWLFIITILAGIPFAIEQGLYWWLEGDFSVFSIAMFLLCCYLTYAVYEFIIPDSAPNGRAGSNYQRQIEPGN